MGSKTNKPEVQRRAVLTAITGASAMAALPALANDIIIDSASLKPGEFTWHPEASPNGGVAVIVSLPEQRVHVYRNGVRIAVSTCSTGKPGHETPTGVFTILQKDKDHHSTTYDNAPMPNMNRLTWDGIALHAGNLPGYPASHGCVRLPLAFSEKLFTVTHIGTPVIIAGAHSDPWALTHPGRLLTGGVEGQFENAVAGLDATHHPSDWASEPGYPVTTLLASSAEARIYLFQDGREVASDTFQVSGGGALGEHVLMLERVGGALHWVGITHHPDPTNPSKPEEAVADRIVVSKAFNKRLTNVMHPGMTLIVSDLPSRPDTRSGADFVILSS
ncbi:MAG: L,D-transpeptidase [Pseudomonadota bacterium]